MSHRVVRWLLPLPLAIGLAAACSSQTPSAPPKSTDAGAAVKAGATVTLKAPGEAISGPTAAPAGVASPKAASPGPVTTSASPVAAQRVEPTGQMVYLWNTGLSPRWYDPQENGQLLTPYVFQYALHDAPVKHMPGQPKAPSLAESYEVAADFKSVTFKLREGITFHNGDPITPEDVKWTYKNYRGANAKLLKDKTAAIETPDPRTVRFVFKDPFLDFMEIYGTPASGAGWIVPAKYYQQVGPDGFKSHPIGAGPYKFVRQTAGTDIELEAFTEYWRKTRGVKTASHRSTRAASSRATSTGRSVSTVMA